MFRRKRKRAANLVQSHYDRGRLLIEQKRYDEAEASFTEAIELAPDFAKAYDGRGLTHVYRDGYEGAIADYSRAIELDPTYVEAYVHRGAAHYHLRHLEEALADFERASELDPSNEDARWNKVMIVAEMGDRRPAQSSLRSAIREATSVSKDPLMAMAAKAPLVQVGIAQMTFMQASSLEEMRKAADQFPFMIEPEFEQLMIHKIVSSRPQFRRHLDWLRHVAKERR